MQRAPPHARRKTIKAVSPGPVAMAQDAQETMAADQDRYAPHGICFGCGPANKDGLQIKSHWGTESEGEREGQPVFVMRFEPQAHHQAFPGVVNGGILGTILDCHSNWCAATALMKHHGWDRAMCTVTADFHVKLKRPTPYPGTLTVKAWCTDIGGDEDRMATVHAEVWADTDKGPKVTATCDGRFVAVKEGHPAYHRWG